jgi:monoamine oxidase
MVVKMLQKDLQDPDTAPRLIEKKYSHVITTTTAPCLQIMDLLNAGLNYAQREAIRVLSYDNAVKVGIKFRYRWWAEDKGITKGGVGTTDRPTRVVVYPSHALDTPEGESGVLMACYNWGQDASRLGGLSQGSDKAKQDAIFDAVMADLAIMHNYPEATLRSLVVSYHVHDWNRDPLVNGHFSFLGPGQFSSFFGQIQRPAARGRLFFAGEITSIYHGWIVAALNSAYRAILQMLLCEFIRAIWDKKKMAYIWLLIVRLEKNWGSKIFEAETEYDTDPKGTAGWQVFLGMYGADV